MVVSFPYGIIISQLVKDKVIPQFGWLVSIDVSYNRYRSGIKLTI